MRIANLSGRLSLIVPDGAIDVERASAGVFGYDPQAIYARWDEFAAWAATVEGPAQPYDEANLNAPVPNPGQVFAVGLNYRDHADESGMARPTTWPPVFTKFPTCIVGPNAEVELPDGGNTDWEVELVVVIGRRAHRVALEDAWSHVAGVTVGQDLSERKLQMASSPPQFSLGKSYPGFGPIGPVVVTLDELADPDDLALDCTVNGVTVQSGRTSQMIFSVPQLIANLSGVSPLLPGDIIFSGTPSGVGQARTPQWFLADGDDLVSSIEGIGVIRNRLVVRPRVTV